MEKKEVFFPPSSLPCQQFPYQRKIKGSRQEAAAEPAAACRARSSKQPPQTAGDEKENMKPDASQVSFAAVESLFVSEIAKFHFFT